ncbi:MAG: hypothetical protein NC036_08510 [Muribaculaceae bacterium]|nr:hypothetical protein [Muribaculaceae bacterium]
MIPLLIILSIVIVVSDLIRLSLMRWKATLLWILVWMAVAYFSTMWLTSLSTDEIYGYLNIRNICLLGLIECFLFMSYLFYDRKGKAILSYYPGLMMIFPVALLAYVISRIVNGISFMAAGAIASLLTGGAIIGITLFLQWFRSEKSWLYIASIISLISYILVLGIV